MAELVAALKAHITDLRYQINLVTNTDRRAALTQIVNEMDNLLAGLPTDLAPAVEEVRKLVSSVELQVLKLKNLV